MARAGPPGETRIGRLGAHPPHRGQRSPAVEQPAHFFSLSLDLSSVTGPDAYFKQVNSAFTRAFGYTEAQLLEHPFIAFVHPDDRTATVVELESLAQGQPTYGFEHRFRCPDGGYRWLSWTAVATPEALVYAAARELTETRRLENERAQSQSRQRAAVVAHSDGFLVSVSHDLQQPLTVIKGQAQVLQRQLARGETVDPERLEKCLSFINAAVMRMHDMIQELLDAALQESGQPLALLLNSTDLVALTRQAVGEHQLAFDLHRFAVEVESPTLVAMVDTARLQRAVGNLLSNAVKYSPDGGPVRVRVAQTQTSQGLMAELVVQDEGLGIPPGDLPRIFERFQRGSNVVGRIAGTGLGLAGVRKIVELHGGSIRVDSEEGIGSTFTVQLPLGRR